MKTLKFTIFMFLVVAFFNTSYSQEVVYSAIFKNVNKTAKSLNHYLNKSGDTLFLKSTFTLNKIEIIGDSGLKNFPVHDSTKELRIPLNDLPLGDYTIVVMHTEGRDDTTIYRKSIIFKVSRLVPIDFGMKNGMNQLQSNYNLAGGQIPILDLSENKIIKDFPKPVGLASNLDEKEEINVDSNKLASRETEKSIGSLSLINIDASGKKNPLRGNIISKSIKKHGNTIEYKPYNLTDMRQGQYVIQSREDYRRNNLRPNGRRYD
ncbi:hypothetical protein [Xanthomarina sp. GH4-25]|uniref:hypothetical protein n=1 Tax=Xanthomarina sp. GH4-25 TaxID=3349335 RepID=UPI0038781451